MNFWRVHRIGVMVHMTKGFEVANEFRHTAVCQAAWKVERFSALFHTTSNAGAFRFAIKTSLKASKRHENNWNVQSFFNFESISWDTYQSRCSPNLQLYISFAISTRSIIFIVLWYQVGAHELNKQTKFRCVILWNSHTFDDKWDDIKHLHSTIGVLEFSQMKSICRTESHRPNFHGTTNNGLPLLLHRQNYNSAIRLFGFYR